jgi:hypothetical protein
VLPLLLLQLLPLLPLLPLLLLLLLRIQPPVISWAAAKDAYQCSQQLTPSYC